MNDSVGPIGDNIWFMNSGLLIVTHQLSPDVARLAVITMGDTINTWLVVFRLWLNKCGKSISNRRNGIIRVIIVTRDNDYGASL
jgi:hypothetical protein